MQLTLTVPEAQYLKLHKNNLNRKSQTLASGMPKTGFLLLNLHALFKFHDFFHDLFKFSKTLRLIVTLKNVHSFPCLGVFFDLKQFNRLKLWCPPKSVLFALCNYSSLSYIVLALSSAVTKLPNKTLISHDSQGVAIKFQDFPGLENEILKLHDFPGFPWPIRTLKNIIIEAFDSISINP